MLKAFGVGLLCTLGIWYFNELIKFLDINKVVYSQQPGPCRAVEGVYVPEQGYQGSEDVEVLPNGIAIFSSGLNYMRNPALKHVQGRMMMFDLSNPDEPAKALRLTGFTRKINPHGISLFTVDGAVYVYFIHHAMDEVDSDESVEKFRLNDLVVAQEDQFYATNDYVLRHRFLRTLEYFSFLPIGNVVYYDGHKGRKVAESLRRANGINMSPDKKYVYVAEAGAKRITTFRRSANGDLSKVSSTFMGTLVDNINVDPETGNLWVASHPIGYKIYLKVAFPVGSVAPSLVLRVNVSEGVITETTQIYSDDGRNLIGSGSAVFQNGKVLIGTPTHILMYCECLTC
ncbi:hypothetical protein RvY_05701 [Ramazzottius varieornatus]|uniref:Paraoxonase n=1 Tax=Ramazzottius varieornatus TaxID=947166 RepID=A0A1D1UVY0_RAMVA|nr:hypothetical protein RvY_05701 [Ramazzottius varieornatus]